MKTEGQGEVQEFVDIVSQFLTIAVTTADSLMYGTLHILSVITVSVYQE